MLKLADCSTDDKYGTYPAKRTIEQILSSCIVIVDKPQGPTSHEVDAIAKRLLHASKSGHAGTLDPQVSGVLPVGINRATPLLHYLSGEKKEYVCLMRFKKPHDDKFILNLLKSQVGAITQTPPALSAVRKVPRKRNIYYIDVHQIKDTDVLFSVGCEAGTYIRTLCSDVGKKCGGASMLELRRISVGGIREETAVNLQALSDAAWLHFERKDETKLRPLLKLPEDLITLPKMFIKDSAIEAVCAGAPLSAKGICSLSEEIRKGLNFAAFSLKGELVAICNSLADADEIAKMQQGIVGKPVRVCMQRGTYPKCWQKK
ncbi:putative tRNA pseudouridine synthase B [Candidatus Anstonella stagnisolia]|nr:putative tRNA pseudouridine synthase B [Candidatus Anstonella stagnisolia]